MAFDRFKGQAQQAAGSVQSAVGHMTGDEGMQAEGLAREVGGQAQDLYGAAKGQVERRSRYRVRCSVRHLSQQR